MKEIILLKYGELVLKGLNRSTFEAKLARTLRTRMRPFGAFDIHYAQSTFYVEPLDDSADIEGAVDACTKIFGFVKVCRSLVVEKDMEAIKAAALTYLPRFLEGCRTFKVESKRSDKRFACKSPQISAEVGEVIYEQLGLEVDVLHPDIVVHVEIRETAAYIHAGQLDGAGGMPVGSAGKGMLLLSGGIDSPVAGYMMAKRGVEVEAVHFESFPYTSERAREKVLELASVISDYCGPVRVHVVSLTKIQEEIARSCEEEYFTLLLRRSMMRIAEHMARRWSCEALITGESLGQVASQTMQALRVTESAVSTLVLRPCIGMDKEEIVAVSRKIGTYETSIEPYEDCCTVFTPRHPKTRPELEKVLAQEAKYDHAALEQEAFEGASLFRPKAESD